MPRTKYFDLTGQQFGQLLVVERASEPARGAVFWKCICDCGVEKKVNSANLRNGTTNSCGCLRKLMASEKFKTHGMTNSATYRAWSGMRTRCKNPKAINYSSYGGRGIDVCQRWELFENFFQDMGEKPIGMTIDRIDVNGNYEPKNCRWATNQEQAKNKRKCKLLNKDSLVNFLKTQSYLEKEHIEMIANNLFKNQHT
jgi:hypothetical protein